MRTGAAAMRCAVLATWLLAPACDRAESSQTYSVVGGEVESWDRASGDLAIRVSRTLGNRPEAEILHCQVTHDSEVYVNDRFCRTDAIPQRGAVEVVGYYDPNPRIERFVVSYAYFDTQPPPPPAPKFSAASDSQPAGPTGS